MILREYSSTERRAVNQVYNGAERYDFEPFFLAIRPDGTPEIYMNTLIGLSVKWLDQKKLADFFESYSGNLNSSDLDVIVWLGLENCLYEKEIGHRPILKSMREKYARDFFSGHAELSRQQMMAMNTRIYEQREVRWADVTGRKRPVLTAGSAKLAEALRLPGTLDTDGVIAALKSVLTEHFRVREFRRAADNKKSVSETMASFLKKVMYRETREKDSLLIRQSGTGSSEKGSMRALERGRRVSARDAGDEAYIRACFGRCLFTEHEMQILNNDLCRGNHEKCRLYIAGAVSDSGDFSAEGNGEPELSAENRKEAVRIRREIDQQTEKNRASLKKSGALVSSGIRSLSAELDTILATFAEPLPEEARHGRLDTAKCYRLALFQDPLVFTHPGDEMEHHIRVDLLLDASASRLNAQETIAVQTWILAKSFMKCHIPVRVMAFRSLRGYTVLQRLKDYHEADPDGILRYYAAGWNRDGLALSAAGRLIRESGRAALAGGNGMTAGGISPFSSNGKIEDGCEHILLVLTDANPDDSTHIPAKDRMGLEREYEGDDAVMDTAQAVKALRHEGIRTMAVYLGSTAHVDNLHLIYGREYVTVRNIETLASGISELFQKALTEIRR
jgi:hypothetical protein